MTDSKISRRYAKALLSLGQDDGKYEEYGQNLIEFDEFCLKNKEFFQVISNQLFSVEERKQVLNSVLDQSTFSDLAKNFLRLLLDKNRISALPDISSYYSRLTDEISQIVRTEVTTAKPLKEKTLEKLEQALTTFTSKKVRIEVSEDKSLIGGIVVRIGDLVLDGSIRAQLRGLQESLKRGKYN